MQSAKIRRHHKKLTIGLVCLLGIFYSCGPQEEAVDYEEAATTGADSSRYAPAKPNTTERDAQDRNLVEIPISVQHSDSGLSLTAYGLTAEASATSFKLEIADCLSGYTQSDIAASTVYVYEFDAGCTAQITEFVFEGVTYDLSHADAVAWSGTAAGSTATLVATTAAAGAGNSLEDERMEMVIDETFSATVQAADALTFSFRQFVKGDTSTLDVAVVQDGGHTVTVSGNAAPNFAIESVSLKSLDTTDGFGNWEFTLLCGSALSDGDTKCDDILLTDIKYTLIRDTFAGGEPSRTDLEDAISGEGLYSLSPGLAVIAGDINASTADPYNGGFSTLGVGANTYVSLSNATRTNIHTDQNMILVLEAHGSFRYFHVDITPVSN